jgi:hypothetical protein
MTLFFINLHARQDFPTTERTKPYPLTWLTHDQKNLSVASSAKTFNTKPGLCIAANRLLIFLHHKSVCSFSSLN